MFLDFLNLMSRTANGGELTLRLQLGYKYINNILNLIEHHPLFNAYFLINVSHP